MMNQKSVQDSYNYENLGNDNPDADKDQVNGQHTRVWTSKGLIDQSEEGVKGKLIEEEEKKEEHIELGKVESSYEPVSFMPTADPSHEPAS
mmetsp:Transcript_24306/g.37565  ORF Transcript_24306/g.37565 Transcript_24306/m.37565 type:complete len:91 (+) Transcript_24306:1165-1437(+)